MSFLYFLGCWMLRASVLLWNSLYFRGLVHRGWERSNCTCQGGDLRGSWPEAIRYEWLVRTFLTVLRSCNCHFFLSVWTFSTREIQIVPKNIEYLTAGLADPYVKGHLGHYRFRTKVIKKTLSPKWLEEFKIPITSWETPSLLVLELRDKDHIFDDMLGSVPILAY